MESLKNCCRCSQNKPVGCFTKDSRRRDGRRSYCKVCESESKKAYTAANPDAIRKRNHEHHVKRWPKKGKAINKGKAIKRLLLIHAGALPDWKIGELRGVSPDTVHRYARKFGISLATIKPHWPPEDDKKLIALKRAGVSQQDIARQLNRSVSAVNWRLVKHRKEGRL